MHRLSPSGPPPRALGPPAGVFRYRVQAEDFAVEEVLGFVPDGTGQHAWLWLEKRGLNTEEVARRLAHLAGVPPGRVGWSGLKDRRAVTRQWFSVDVGGVREPDWGSLEAPALKVLAVTRHGRKLRRGTHRANRFRLVLRECTVPAPEMERRLGRAAACGVPNFFGPQRFGHRGDNLTRARGWLLGGNRPAHRHQRGLYLSAARAWLFNRVLAARVRDGSWDRALPGEILMLAGSRSHFHCGNVSDEIVARVALGDLSPSGPLWGRGGEAPSGEAAEVEARALVPERRLCRALERMGVAADRRPLVLRPQALAWSRPAADTWRLEFTLPRGAYATTLLNELGGMIEGPATC